MPKFYDEGVSLKKKRIKRKRKIIIRRIVATVLTVLLALSVIFTSLYVCRYFFPDLFGSGIANIPFGGKLSEKVEKAKETVLPEWVDVQLINFHTTARTGKNLSDIKNIVIHYVGNPNTSAQNNRNYFNKIDTKVSSHFVVGLEGEVIQCVPIYEWSAASNERNKDTISIEVCHPDETGEFLDATYESLIELTAFLCNEFSLDTDDVIRHYDITEKICPKYYVENEDEWIKFKEDAKIKLDEYKLLEQQILLYTKDMEIGKNKQLSNVIKIANDNGIVLSANIYEILNLFDRDKFVVYSVWPEQYASLIKLISEEKIEDIKSLIGAHQGLLLHKQKDDYIKLAIEEGCGAYYLKDNRINHDVNLDKVNIKSFENLDDDTIIFYTTETIDDILNSYKKYSEINLTEVQGPVLKKTKL